MTMSVVIASDEGHDPINFPERPGLLKIESHVNYGFNISVRMFFTSCQVVVIV